MLTGGRRDGKDCRRGPSSTCTSRCGGRSRTPSVGLATRNAADKARVPKQTRNREAMRTWTPNSSVRSSRRATSIGSMRCGAAREHRDAPWRGARAELGSRRPRQATHRRPPVACQRCVCQRCVRARVGRAENRQEPPQLALDPGTADVLREYRRLQLQKGLALGPAWRDNGVLFTRERRSAAAPGSGQQALRRMSRRAGRRVSGCTTCDIRTRRSLYKPMCIRRSFGAPRALDHLDDVGHVLARPPGDAGGEGGGAFYGAAVSGVFAIRSQSRSRSSRHWNPKAPQECEASQRAREDSNL